MLTEKHYQLVLTKIPNIGPVQIKQLLEIVPTAKDLFTMSIKELMTIENMGIVKAKAFKEFDDWDIIKEEILYTEKHGIDIVFLLDKDYPFKLKQIPDPPTILFKKGNANLNTEKSISIIGTRANSSYGRSVTENLIQYLHSLNVTVYSGLAIGIDAIAHKASLENNIPTIGVLGHGFKHLYPYENRKLADEMIAHNGALLSEYFHNTPPDKFNFPMRNRIVAGISDATIVIETAEKGGSMITAQLANDYSRDVFALPGKISDMKSQGCNLLIQDKKAEIYTSPEKFVQSMNWDLQPKKKNIQRKIFVEMTELEEKIFRILKDLNTVSIDQLQQNLSFSSSSIAGALLNLELNGVIKCAPGKLYELL